MAIHPFKIFEKTIPRMVVVNQDLIDLGKRILQNGDNGQNAAMKRNAEKRLSLAERVLAGDFNFKGVIFLDELGRL